MGQDAEFAVVRVKDNGLGMTVAELDKLFKPFHTTKPNGTGLGLVIVKKMLARMGGTIRIDSVQDKGTAVTMMVPKAKGNEHAGSQPPAPDH